MRIVARIFLTFTLMPAGGHAVEKGLPYPLQKPDGLQIAEQIYFVNHFYAFDILEIDGARDKLLKIINYQPGSKPKQMSASRFVNHRLSNPGIKTRDLVIFSSGKVKGTGILATDYQQDGKSMGISIWLPALRKIRRFSEPAHEDIWAGSILTFGDIYLRRPEHETHELLGEEPLEHCLDSMQVPLQDRDEKPLLVEPDCSVKGRSVYLLKSTHKKQNWWYDYRLRWVDKESFTEYQVHYFRDDKKIKIMTKSWYAAETGDPRARIWRWWYARSEESGQQGIAIIPAESVQINTGRNERFWSESTLRKIHR